MGMNIKNSETERLARKLAQRTGETLTTAITIALRERLDRQDKAEAQESRLDWLKRISTSTAAIMNDGLTSKEIMDELYDEETGLPR